MKKILLVGLLSIALFSHMQAMQQELALADAATRSTATPPPPPPPPAAPAPAAATLKAAAQPASPKGNLMGELAGALLKRSSSSGSANAAGSPSSTAKPQAGAQKKSPAELAALAAKAQERSPLAKGAAKKAAAKAPPKPMTKKAEPGKRQGGLSCEQTQAATNKALGEQAGAMSSALSQLQNSSMLARSQSNSLAAGAASSAVAASSASSAAANRAKQTVDSLSAFIKYNDAIKAEVEQALLLDETQFRQKVTHIFSRGEEACLSFLIELAKISEENGQKKMALFLDKYIEYNDGHTYIDRINKISTLYILSKVVEVLKEQGGKEVMQTLATMTQLIEARIPLWITLTIGMLQRSSGDQAENYAHMPEMETFNREIHELFEWDVSPDDLIKLLYHFCRSVEAVHFDEKCNVIADKIVEYALSYNKRTGRDIFQANNQALFCCLFAYEYILKNNKFSQLLEKVYANPTFNQAKSSPEAARPAAEAAALPAQPTTLPEPVQKTPTQEQASSSARALNESNKSILTNDPSSYAKAIKELEEEVKALESEPVDQEFLKRMIGNLGWTPTEQSADQVNAEMDLICTIFELRLRLADKDESMEIASLIGSLRNIDAIRIKIVNMLGCIYNERKKACDKMGIASDNPLDIVIPWIWTGQSAFNSEKGEDEPVEGTGRWEIDKNALIAELVRRGAERNSCCDYYDEYLDEIGAINDQIDALESEFNQKIEEFAQQLKEKNVARKVVLAQGQEKLAALKQRLHELERTKERLDQAAREQLAKERNDLLAAQRALELQRAQALAGQEALARAQEELVRQRTQDLERQRIIDQARLELEERERLQQEERQRAQDAASAAQSTNASSAQASTVAQNAGAPSGVTQQNQAAVVPPIIQSNTGASAPIISIMNHPSSAQSTSSIFGSVKNLLTKAIIAILGVGGATKIVQAATKPAKISDSILRDESAQNDPLIAAIAALLHKSCTVVSNSQIYRNSLDELDSVLNELYEDLAEAAHTTHELTPSEAATKLNTLFKLREYQTLSDLLKECSVKVAQSLDRESLKAEWVNAIQKPYSDYVHEVCTKMKNVFTGAHPAKAQFYNVNASNSNANHSERKAVNLGVIRETMQEIFDTFERINAFVAE